MTSEEWTPAFENMPKLHGDGDIDLLYFDATLIATTALIDDRKLILQWDTHAIENFRLSDYNRGLPMAVDLSVPMHVCLLYTSPSPRDQRGSRMPSSA